MRSDHMEIRQDRSGNEPQFPLFLYYDRFHRGYRLNLHWHEEFEFMRVLRGRVCIRVEERSYLVEQGECVFINSAYLHAVDPVPEGEDALTRALLIRPSLLQSGGYDIVQSKYLLPLVAGDVYTAVHIKPESAQSTALLAALDEIADLLSGDGYGREMAIKAKLYHAFFCLFQLAPEEGAGANAVGAGSRRDALRLKKTLEYIYMHLGERIAIAELAAHIGMSEGHFTRFFKKMVKQTPVRYINHCKISEAARLLQETDKKELEIAMDVGFENFSYFINIFKEVMHCTPSQYRKMTETGGAHPYGTAKVGPAQVG